MTILHHPSEETLTRYAAGTLEPGSRLVASVHLTGCAACRTRVMEYEAIGGAILAELPLTPMAPEALARTLALIDAPEPVTPPRRERLAPPALTKSVDLPEPLYSCEIGPWRWVAPGIRWSRIRLPEAEAANVFLLRAGPGKRLPEHGHTGTELAQVLLGSFSEGGHRYQQGDLSEADSNVEHQPVVGSDSECICLIAVEGGLRLRGLAGLLQPFIGL